MKHIKLFESFNELEDSDIEMIEEFMNVLDFPRQNYDGHLVPRGYITISKDIIGSTYEPGFRILEKKPHLFKHPMVKRMMQNWRIEDIDISTGNDEITINYKPMDEIEFTREGYDDNMTYDEYLAYF